MAKLKSLLEFNGSLEGMTVYKLPHVKEPIVKATWGPSAHDINTKPQYEVTRHNLAENAGRNKAVHWLMKAFNPLKPLADADTAGLLNKLLRAMQKSDTGRPFGARAVLFSRFPQLLEGFSLTKATPFDAVVRGEVYTKLERSTLSASVELPALLPRLTFFAPPGYTYGRLVATLGVAPDLLSGVHGWGTDGDYGNCFAQAAQTELFAAGAGLSPTTLSLTLPYTPPTDSFALVLTVAVQWGAPGFTGALEPVLGRVGCGKIVAAE